MSFVLLDLLTGSHKVTVVVVVVGVVVVVDLSEVTRTS